MDNIFEEIKKLGHDEDFTPLDIADLDPTDAPVGSRRKLEIMARRVEGGFPIFHPDDSHDYGEDAGVELAPRHRKRRFR